MRRASSRHSGRWRLQSASPHQSAQTLRICASPDIEVRQFITGHHMHCSLPPVQLSQTSSSGRRSTPRASLGARPGRRAPSCKEDKRAMSPCILEASEIVQCAETARAKQSPSYACTTAACQEASRDCTGTMRRSGLLLQQGLLASAPLQPHTCSRHCQGGLCQVVQLHHPFSCTPTHSGNSSGCIEQSSEDSQVCSQHSLLSTTSCQVQCETW
jgi:hypothetical protein